MRNLESVAAALAEPDVPVNGSAAGKALCAWIREHRVTSEFGRLIELVEHQPVSIGFELRLFARHAAQERIMPGCERCRDLYQQLCRVAQAAFPRGGRATRYEIDPFDAAFHLRPEASWLPEVQLTVHIVHREGYLGAVDDCQKACADEMRKGLGRLGVQERTWSEPTTGVSYPVGNEAVSS
jgi:hypothetical protein